MNGEVNGEVNGVRWSHVALNCRDLDVTEAFYREWFGFSRANAFDLGDTRIVFLRLGDAYLELFGGKAVGDAADPVEGDGPTASGRARHLAFQVENVNALLERMGSAAVVSGGPLEFDEFIPGWRSVWLTDPDGVVVEVSQGYQDDPAVAHVH